MSTDGNHTRLSGGWLKAMTLTERAVSRPASQDQRQVDSEIAERRAKRWRSQAPFPTEPYFRQRLEADQLTETDFRYLVGETADSLSARFPTPLPWLRELEEAFGATAAAPCGAQEALWPEGLPRRQTAGFLAVAEPLVRRGRERLRRGVEALRRTHPSPQFNPAAIERMLLHNLVPSLLWILSRTIVLELNVARLMGVLEGGTPEERFSSYMERLRLGEVGTTIFEEYPVLARQVVGRISRWVDFSLEILGRLCADWELIRTTFCPDRDPGSLASAAAGAGDTHRGGRSVVILSFESGFRLVYKPHSLRVDMHFGQLLDWLNARGNPVQFRTPRILDRGTYGWGEFVPAEGCKSQEALWRFYERQGGHLAVLYALEATDFHAENLIAAGEHPVLVDLEALFHPRVRGPDTGPLVGTAAVETMGRSVLRIGLLPQRLWTNADFEGVDLSGLGGAAGQLSPYRMPLWDKEGTDEMRLVRQRIRMGGSQNRPSLNGVEAGVQDYVEPLVTGFATTYESLMRHRDELLADDGPLSVFASDEVRAVLRATQTYALLLNESYHPDVLRDALDRDQLFDRLWVGVDQRPYLARMIPFERADLLHGDIPLFTCRPGSRDLWTSHGERLADFLSEPSLLEVRHRLRQLSSQDLTRQIWFIRASLTTLTIGKQQATWAGYGLKESPGERVDPRQVLDAARAVADRLEALALRDAENVSWVGVTLVNEKVWTLLPVGGDLYSGLPGIALFLAHAGAITGEERYASLARAALATVRRQLEPTLSSPTPLGVIGAFNGWGGLIYTLTHLGVLWEARDLIREAEGLVEFLPDLIAKDDQLDIVSGAAGCLAALLGLYRCAPTDRTLAAAVRCGDRLLERAQPMANGVGWTTPIPAMKPLTGLSHGAAGMAWPLLELSAVSGDQRFRQIALQALTYERSQLLSDVGNWPDFRIFDQSARQETSDGSPKTMLAWCHGAPGIGLSRLACLQHIEDADIRVDLEVALNTTDGRGFGANHSLCHGDLGNLELLLQADQLLDDGRWRRRCDELAVGILKSMADHRWICGVPSGVETPGLMTGLAGIGYGLLRLACPGRVPSLLTLAPPGEVG